MRKKTVKYKIRGDDWKIIFLNDELYLKAHPDMPGSIGITEPTEKRITFKCSEFSEGKVRHELVHAVFKYMCLGDTNSISVDDMEEIFAKYMDTFGKQHIEIAADIFKKFSKTAEKIAQFEKSQ